MWQIVLSLLMMKKLSLTEFTNLFSQLISGGGIISCLQYSILLLTATHTTKSIYIITNTNSYDYYYYLH